MLKGVMCHLRMLPIKTIYKTILILIGTGLCLSVSVASIPRHFPVRVPQVFIAKQPSIHAEYLRQIAPLIQHSIQMGTYPGAVVLAGRKDSIIYQGVFGSQQILPKPLPMQSDTIFDVASLTKVMVTTTAIMQLVEQGKLDLDKPVAFYWPAFARQHKSAITLRDLLTHTSGLPEDIASEELNQILPPAKRIHPVLNWHGRAAALQQIINLEPRAPRGSRFIYSDINFIILGYLVEIISHEPLQVYAANHIFKIAGMIDSQFLPSSSRRGRIAPTEILNGRLHWGEVHDPTVSLMGGVAGMAGLFTTAHDLGRFAQILLQHGRVAHSDQYLLSPRSVAEMIATQTPLVLTTQRGLGWDRQSAFSCRGITFSPLSFGHTGWTGASLWIDPEKDVWLVVLTSRTHPKPDAENQLLEDRRTVADWVGKAVSLSS